MKIKILKIFDKKGDKDLALLHLKNSDVLKENLEIQENDKERIKAELNFEYEKQKIEQKQLAHQERLKWFFYFLLTNSSIEISRPSQISSK